jgi:hypothetical protein
VASRCGFETSANTDYMGFVNSGSIFCSRESLMLNSWKELENWV